MPSHPILTPSSNLDSAKLIKSVANIGPKGKCRFRTPTVLQMEATECGAACLAMILGHFGRQVPLEVLRVACGVSRDGSKAANILRAARAYGLEAKGFRREPKTIASLPFPMIVFWNFNHFVVLEGIDLKRRRAWLNDPASGSRAITLDEFDRSFTGVCLAFARTTAFVEGGDPLSLFGKLRPRLHGSGTALSFLLVATLALILPGLAVPVFSKVFVDTVLAQNLQNWLMPLLIGMGTTALLRGGLTHLQQLCLARLEMKLSLITSASFFWHVLRLPMEFFSQRHPGDIGSRVSSNDRVAEMLSGQLATNAVGLVSIVFYGAVMLGYDVVLTLVGAATGLINLAMLWLVARLREDGSRRLLKYQGQMASSSVGGIVLAETLKSSGAETEYFTRWAGVQANYLNAQQSLSFYSTMLNAVPPLLAALSDAVVLGVGGLRVMDGVLTVGGIVAFQSLLQSFNQPIAGLVSLGGSFQTIKGDLMRLDDVLNYQRAPRLSAAETAISDESSQRLSGRVEIRDLVFGYNRLEPPLLNGITLSIMPGQRVALVGGSGSGKSTLARLIVGLYQPWSGEILFDGVPLAGISHQRFAGSVSLVDQDIFLFEGTVAENLSMWDDSMGDGDIARALRDAAVLDTVEARPGRFDAAVGEGGMNFSGGQRQRLEIARALTGNPSVLVLDEATSALDALVEKEIDDNLRRRGCTCVIVAHRLSTIRDCDEIIVLDQGQAVQRGTHEELIGVDGRYRQLVLSE